MSNLGVLYCYELKKLFNRKMAWIVVLVLAAIMAYAAWPIKTSGVANFSLTDQEGNTISGYVSVEEQRRLRQEGELQISGQVMDDLFFQNVRAASGGNGQYIIKDNFDAESYFYLVDNSYYKLHSVIKYDMDLDPTEITAKQFYQSRQQKIEMQWSELSNGELAYWQAMEAQVEKPFVYRYSNGYQDIVLNAFGLSSVIPLIAAVCLCGVFSEERRTRTDALIFSSRQGRFPQYLAKVLAGVTVTLAATLFVIGANVAVVLLTRGCEGFDAALQLWNLTSSFPITVGQAALIMVGLLLLYGLLSGGITMLFSVLTQNTIAAIAGPVLLMLCQSWLRLDVQAAEYLPNQLFNVIPSFRNFHLVNFFGIYLNNLQFGFIIYGTLAVILTTLCWLGWRRSATGRA